MALPARPSPFYTLRSVGSATPRPRSAGKARPLPSGTSGEREERDYREVPYAAVALDVGGAGFVSVGLSADVDADSSCATLLARREAALAECARLDEQDRRTKESLVRERRANTAADNSAKATLHSAKALEAAVRDELLVITSQQKHLKALRTQLKQLQTMRNGGAASPVLLRAAEAALGLVAPAVEAPKRPASAPRPFRGRGRRAGGGGGGRGGEGAASDRQPALDAAPVTPKNDGGVVSDSGAADLGNLEPEMTPTAVPVSAGETDAAPAVGSSLPDPNGDVDLTLDNLLREVREVTRAASPDIPPSLVGAEGDDAASDVSDAEVELLRSNGCVFARLRHPAGSEALVDLRGALVFSWRLAEGFVVAGARLPSIRPDVLMQGVPWQTAKIDDSNNEPSVSLTSDGNTRWRAKRTFTLSGAALQEELLVENLSSFELSFRLGEEAYDEEISGRPAAEHLHVEERNLERNLRRSAVKPAALKREGVSGDVGAGTVLLPAMGSWSVAQRWTV